MSVVTGPHQVAFSQAKTQLLTLDEPNGHVLVKLPNDQPGHEGWHVEVLPPGDRITLKNFQFNTFAGPNGEVEPGVPVVGTDKPFEFELEPTGNRGEFRLRVPGATTEGRSLYLGVPKITEYPAKASKRVDGPSSLGSAKCIALDPIDLRPGGVDFRAPHAINTRGLKLMA
ncbi:hypothetical protein CTheo_4582 [Ceratobasidium theobromae]|uniref:Uncharacterized protein n=1 Tax=Ceratobasidium theobromae TaxID=1582974 RepID=A0A5N5QLE8_9AGAM|nr:hypothetical protein CTheo_4582 [Ceratobasidium theobromae]